MKLIIQDLTAEAFKKVCSPELKDIRVITNEENSIAHCIGCFGCWVKSPGVCVINDGYDLTGPAFATSEEVIIITKIQYGGY
ncbi:MAG: flavodoxin family protein, partial [Eubacterium sp.]